MAFTFYRQHDAMDCGPSCLRMIARFYGIEVSLLRLRQLCRISREGVSLQGISEAAEQLGFRSLGVRISLAQLYNDAPRPAILHWGKKHFVVLPPQRGNRRRGISIADPAKGMIRVDERTFKEQWLQSDGLGICLLLEPEPALLEQETAGVQDLGWQHLFFYLKQHRRFFFQVILGMLAGCLLQLLFPFLTQSLIDQGIQGRDLHFIHILLLAQLSLFFARTLIDFIRSRLLLFVSSRINISLLTGFWHKLMRLPMSFFDTKLTGDLQQRLQDQHDIEAFLTTHSISLLFSSLNLLIFTAVLLVYSLPVTGIFIAGSLLYFFWVRLFLAKRRDLNYSRFEIAAREQTTTLQLIQGMQEIKLNNAVRFFRWQWEHIQIRIFRLSARQLSLNQYQQAGAFFINEGKNILITFYMARLVLLGQLSLGAMLAIQYIIGQLNSPVEQMISFSRSIQDARIALDRLNEIHASRDEEPQGHPFMEQLPEDKTISIRQLSFSYNGAGNLPVLQDIDLDIPARQVTAIVGTSGSGKTTLLRLLLQFYDQYSGQIRVGNTPLSHLRPSTWRSCCGSVLQDGFVFNDTIAANIAVGCAEPDPERLQYACMIANLGAFIDSLPLGIHTQIGAEGNGISQGQKQRILIARAVYKQPEYILFDEATNALDAHNEKLIMAQLATFFKGKTVIIVAHRLSTVRNADKIVVVHAGRIVEEGTHETLVHRKGYYYELVKNQLELGT